MLPGCLNNLTINFSTLSESFLTLRKSKITLCACFDALLKRFLMVVSLLLMRVLISHIVPSISTSGLLVFVVLLGRISSILKPNWVRWTQV